MKMKIVRKLYKLYKKNTFRKQCVFLGEVTFDRRFKCEGANKVGGNAVLLNTDIGYGSYIGECCFLKNCKIGRYASIGSDVRCVIGRHPSQIFVSTHPVFYSIRKHIGKTYVEENKFEEFKFIDTIEEKSIIIGSDVWIGESVRILEGIKIGDGAIVGTGAVVTKNVPPYAIVGGVPAKIIKYRFTEQEITELLNIKWWDKEEQWIKDNVSSFLDIGEFLKLRGRKK